MKRALGERQMQMLPSASLNRFYQMEDNSAISPYSYLACAIICVAADDYRVAIKDNNTLLKKELEKFFYSEWFSLLSDINPYYLLNNILCEFKDRLHEC